MVAVGSRERKRRSRREREQLLREYQASGLTRSDLRSGRESRSARWRAWIYKMRTPASDAGGGFAPVRIVDDVRPMKSRGSVTVR